MVIYLLKADTNLYLTIQNLLSSLEIAFPEELGISEFGNHLVRNENGFNVSFIDSYEGPTIYFEGPGSNAKIVCDDIGCQFQ